MFKNKVVVLAVLFFFAVVAAVGCGSSSSDSPSFGWNGNTPGGTGGQSPVTSGTAKGYVYKAAAKSTGGELLYSPSSAAPAGYIPAPNVLVTIPTFPPVEATTDANGFFEILLNTYITSPIAFIQDPATGLSAHCVIAIGGITSQTAGELAIFPPFDGTGALVMNSGQSTIFNLSGSYNGNWLSVQESVTWTVSPATLGAFSGAYFQAANTDTNLSGTVTATTAGGRSASISLTVLASGGAQAGLYGKVTDQATGLTVANAFVEATGMTYAVTKTASTNAEGNYTITGIPSGQYKLKVYANGKTYSTPLVSVNGNTEQDIILGTGGGGESPSVNLSTRITTDKLGYAPGEKIKIALSVSNFTMNTISLPAGTIGFSLAEKDLMAGTARTLATTTVNYSAQSLAPMGSAQLVNGAELTVPAGFTPAVGKYYVIQGVTGQGTSFAITEGSVILSSSGGSTPPGGGDSSDASLLIDAYSAVSDAYSILNEAATRAQAGDDVTSMVNSSSSLRSKLSTAQTKISNLKNVSEKSKWLSDISYINGKLTDYSLSSSKPSSYLTDARSRLSTLKNEIYYKK